MEKIIGHDENKERFARALSRNRLPSTFLFIGPESIGKRSFAVELAKSLLCESTPENTLENCGSCEACLMIDNGNHPDFEFVHRLDGNAFLSVDQFIGDRQHRNREGLCYNFSLKPNRGTRKVAVIDDADFFNSESANCLLKTLEEPPPRSVLILIGTAVDKIINTIRSRSQIFHFDRLSEEQIMEILSQSEETELPGPVEQIARLGEGTLRGIKLLQEEGLMEFRDLLLKALSSLEPMANGFPKELAGFVDQAGKESFHRRNRLRLVVDFAIEFYSAVAAILSGASLEHFALLQDVAGKAADKWTADAEAATLCIERSMDANIQIGANANLATLIEAWLSDLGKLSRGEETYLNNREFLTA